MKYAYRNREFWCRGYYVDTVIKNTKAITQYIKNQLENDRMTDQLALFDPKGPFSKVAAGNRRNAGRHSYAHLCAANYIRAMPENEIPPARLVDSY